MRKNKGIKKSTGGMRKTMFSVVFTMVVCMMVFSSSGCSDKKQSPTRVDSADTEKTELPSDTMEQIISETPMPKAADELFDDFIFNFAANRNLQFKRIVFPLPVIANGDTAFITAKRWKMERFFMHQDFYTIIFDNRRQMNAVKDTTIDNAVVEKINLNRMVVKQYVFERDNGQWMMTKIVNGRIGNSKNASFLRFYQKFVSDTAFQVKSINDPLDFTGPNPDDDFSNMSGILAPEQWPSFAPELPQNVIYNILYGQKYSESKQKIFVIRGIANGLETELTFRKKDGQWKLMKIIM